MSKGYLWEKYGNAYFVLSVIATLLSITATVRLHFRLKKDEILLDLEEEKLKIELKK